MLTPKKIFNDILTGKDNKTADAGRFWYSVCMIVFNFATLINVIKSPTDSFAETTYATAAATLTAGFFAALFIKRDTEPGETTEASSDTQKTTPEGNNDV